MNILAIHKGHNANIGYFQNGTCLYIEHEERFTNKKNHIGFPYKSLDYLKTKVDFDKLDRVVIPTLTSFPGEIVEYNLEGKKRLIGHLNDNNFSFIQKLYRYLEFITGFKILFTGLRNLFLRSFSAAQGIPQLKKVLEKKYSIPVNKIKFYNHHECHCLTPFYFYGLHLLKRDLLLFSMDGAGDFDFARVYRYSFKDKSLKLLVKNSFDNSLGLLYSRLTNYLGMKSNEHEYKVMGLAAYVKEKEYFYKIYKKLQTILDFDEVKGIF